MLICCRFTLQWKRSQQHINANIDMVNRVSACFICLINVHMYYIILSKAIVIEGVGGGGSSQEFVLATFMQNDAILGNTYLCIKERIELPILKPMDI